MVEMCCCWSDDVDGTPLRTGTFQPLAEGRIIIRNIIILKSSNQQINSLFDIDENDNTAATATDEASMEKTIICNMHM
jgi:hypothetical protein